MEKLKQWIRQWLGAVEFREYVHCQNRDEKRIDAQDAVIAELRARVEDLEAAYPDYNKAKEKADADQKNEVVPGFRPFSQRKRGWENAHRKTADKKEQSGSV